LYNYILLFIIIIKDRTNFFFHIMKKNEKRCTLHTSFEKVMAMFIKLNEVYATIHKLVKVQLVKIVLKNHRHTFVELDCHPSTLSEKNSHIDPKIKQWLMYTHNNSSTLYLHKLNTKTMFPYVCLASTSRHPSINSKK